MTDSDQNLDNDYEFSRGVYYDLITKGQEALDRMVDVADETAHPRSYEVLSGMIKHISDVNDRLMMLHKTRKEIKKVDAPTPQQIEDGRPTAVIMTATELQRMIQAQPKGEVIDAVPINETDE